MEKISRWRIRLIQLCFFLLTIAVIASLYRWQVVEHETYEAYAQQRFSSQRLSSLRGPILASDGSPLAFSVPAYDVYVYMPNVEQAENRGNQTREEFLVALSTILKIDSDDLEKTIDSNEGNIFIASLIDADKKQRLLDFRTEKENPLAGIDFITKEQRIYTDDYLASQILGFVGKTASGEDVGAYGIEGYWEGDLKWKEGLLYEERDSFGNQIVTGELTPIQPKVGRTITLTVDRGVQQILQENLNEMSSIWGVKKASGVIIDPRTGAILAIANYPTYNGNEYWNVENVGVHNNFAISDPFEFGSVGKAFTAATAVDLEIAEPYDVILESHTGCTYITQGEIEWEICTSSRQAHGPLTVVDMLKESDNLGAYELSRQVGPRDFYSYLTEFGFGRVSNVGMAEENTSYLKSWESWNKADIATYSFGQGYSATALQVTSAFTTLANNGERMQPYIVSTLKDDQKEITITPRVAGEVISSEAATKTTDMLVQVYESWNQARYYPELNNYRIAAKSGTAQIPDETGLAYAQGKVANTIVGYDAGEDPKFVMLMTLHEPNGTPYAIESVLPTWTKTFLEIKDLLGVVPYTAS